MAIYKGDTQLKAYKGDMQPVNIYKGSTKIAGWHSSNYSGASPLAVDCDYNVPPDALVIDGKCQQTVGVWGTNLIPNGDFSNGTTGLVAIAATISANGNTLSVTGSGTGVYPQFSEKTGTPILQHKYYKRARTRVTTAYTGTAYLGLNVRGTVSGSAAQLITNPVVNQWYQFSSITDFSATAVSGDIQCVVHHQYASAAEALNKVMEVRNCLSIDLTATFGAGNEPTAEQMDAYLAAYPNSWFDGSALLTTNGTPNSPSPTYPAPITTITGDLTITAANGDLSDTVVTPLGSVELRSLPDGTKDTYDAVTGVVTKRVGKYVGASGTSWEITDAATNASFISDKIQPGTLAGQTLTALSTCAPTVYYKLAEPYTIQLTPDLPVVRTGIKTLSIGADVAPTLSATVKSMDQGEQV